MREQVADVALPQVMHTHARERYLIGRDREGVANVAEDYSDATGSTVVVANSLVIASILGTPAPVGTAIAVAPGAAAVGHASEADDVVVFELDGGAPRVAFEQL